MQSRTKLVWRSIADSVEGFLAWQVELARQGGRFELRALADGQVYPAPTSRAFGIENREFIEGIRPIVARYGGTLALFDIYD